jgi:hypothetical protein
MYLTFRDLSVTGAEFWPLEITENDIHYQVPKLHFVEHDRLHKDQSVYLYSSNGLTFKIAKNRTFVNIL